MKRTGNIWAGAVLSIVLGGIVLLAGGNAVGQELSVSSRVDSQRIGEQDQLQFTIELSGPGSGNVKTINLPTMKNLKVVAGPSTSTRFQWVNGVSSSAKSLTYILLPTSKGEAEIPPVTVEYGGRTYRTEPIKIEIVAGSVKRREEPRQLPFPDISGRQEKRAEPDVIAKAVVDENRLFQGEQLTLSYRIYTTVNILDINVNEMPSYEGFWVEDMKVDPQASARIVEMNGKQYYEYTIMKKALFPATPGKKTIKSLTFAVTVRSRGGDFFDSMFFDNPIRIFRKTEDVQLEIMPLPDRGVPPSFTGAVGDFRMTVEADRKECAVNDAVGVKVSVEGTGNLKGISLPAIAEVPDFKVYEPKVSEDSRFEGEKLRSKKIWDYVFIPLAPGEHSIPEMRFSYFDPLKSRYEIAESSKLPLLVKKGERETSNVTIVQKGDITPLRNDINFIKPLRGEIRNAGAPLYRQGWFFIALLLPIFGVPAYVFLSSRRERARIDIGSTRMKKASRNARGLLRKARKLSKKADPEIALQEVSKAMVGYVADKFNQSALGLTYEKIEELLESKSADEKIIRKFLSTLEKCDYARFSKSSVSADEIAGLLDQAESSLSELERIV